MPWITNVQFLNNCLLSLLATEQNGQVIETDEAFKTLLNITTQLRAKKRLVYFIGNGASAAMASHYSADLAKNGKVHTQVLTDLALMTAVSNDINYESVFSEPLQNRIISGDMLVAISSSGNSPNIIKGVKTALSLGATVITLSAMKETNQLRKLGHINFYVATNTYGMSETSHNAILHHWIDLLLGDAK
ncbi:MAG: hypothetical protein A3E87_05145 [Gammaproteobacteria bacterium RIFCSPHIGHO2_12_FULL_35_23]|nr:MAG: hypothetical protein A3E87_05145 [Gammaproteobacteria bacterium RIFCSPHIGHO2_12_FULL_35_23]